MRRLHTAEGPAQGVLSRYYMDRPSDLDGRLLDGLRRNTRDRAYARAGRAPRLPNHRAMQWFLRTAADAFGWQASTEVMLRLGAPSCRHYGMADLTLSHTSARWDPQVVVELKVTIENDWELRRGVYQACVYRVASYGAQTFLVACELADGLDLAWASRLNVSVLTVDQFLRWMSADERPALQAVA